MSEAKKMQRPLYEFRMFTVENCFIKVYDEIDSLLEKVHEQQQLIEKLQKDVAALQKPQPKPTPPAPAPTPVPTPAPVPVPIPSPAPGLISRKKV